jgi:hypothetical protein
VKLTKKDGTSVEFLAMVQSDQNSVLNQTKAIALEDIRVVRGYHDVFPAELPGMPPDHDIEFLIELLPGTPPISKRPYTMPINELVELKKQIAELWLKDLYDLAHHHGEHLCYLWQKRMEPNGCASIIDH